MAKSHLHPQGGLGQAVWCGDRLVSGEGLLACVTCRAMGWRQDSSPTCTTSVSDDSVARPLTQHVSGVDLQYQPAVAILFVRAKDGEYGALLPGLGKQAVHKHRLL